MYTWKGATCSSNGCTTNTTACPTSQWTEGYPAYGLTGIKYEGYSYTSDTGFSKMMKPGDDGKFYLEDQIHMFTHDGSNVPMYKGELENASTISYLLYDIKDINDSYDIDNIGPFNKTAVSFKSINEMDVGLSADGMSFVWAEYLPERPVMYVIKDETTPTLTVLLADKLGNPIDFNHPAYRGLVNINDRLSIKRSDITSCDADTNTCCSDFIVRTVVAKGTAEFNGKVYPTVTLEGGEKLGEPEKLTFKGRNGFGGNADLECLNNANAYSDGMYPGDEVKFEFGSFDPCNPVLGGYQVQGYTMKHSSIQYIGKTITLTRQELRMGYDTPEGVSTILGQKLRAISRDFTEQKARTFWLGENRRYNNAAGIPASTMGLLTQIYAEHARNPHKRLIRSAANAITAEDKAMIFMETLMQCQRSKWSGQNPTITVVMDDKALATYYSLNKAFKNIGGWLEVISPTQDFNFGQLRMINTPYGKMELLQDSFLQEIYGNSGVCVFLDKKLVGARQTEEFTADLESGSNKVTRTKTVGFQIQDVTSRKVVGQWCKEYTIWTSFAYVMVGIGQEYSPYAILEGFN